MVVSFVVRTKIAKFGPGQFNFVLAKTEIPVFGPGQHHPARGGERFRRIFARARAPASAGSRKRHYFDRPRASTPTRAPIGPVWCTSVCICWVRAPNRGFWCTSTSYRYFNPCIWGQKRTDSSTLGRQSVRFPHFSHGFRYRPPFWEATAGIFRELPKLPENPCP